MFYYWRNQQIPDEIRELPDDFSETELITGLEAAGYSIEDLELIIITHGHPDHYLLGNEIVQRCNARVSAHVLDTDQICNPWTISKKVFEGRSRYEAMGMPLPVFSAQDYHKKAVPEFSNMSLKVDSPISMDGFLSLDGIRSQYISVKHSPGHSPGAICLIIDSQEEQRIIICGDVLLYPITPHPDDLVTYLRTLDELKRTENIVLSLPAHGKNIRDHYRRVNSLQNHHRNRLEFTYNSCNEPKSPWEIASMPRYFDVFVDPNKFNPMAGNEAFIHMRLLEMAKGLYRSKGDGNVHYFQNTKESFDDVYQRVLKIINDRGTTAL